MRHLKPYKIFTEDATCNASNTAGMGSVISAQPGSLPGTTGTTGSGDIGFTFKPEKKRKKGKPNEVSDLRDLEPAKTNKVEESVENQSKLYEKLKSINEFGKYLEKLGSPLNMAFFGKKVSKIYGIQSYTCHVSDLRIYKLCQWFHLETDVINKHIDELYTLSQSERHDMGLVDIIKDILLEIEDLGLIKIKEVRPEYDLNIKKENQTLVPKFGVYFDPGLSSKFTELSAPETSHLSFEVRKLENRFEAYGLELIRVQGRVITLKQI